jgi:hypothetical protein
MEAAFRTSFADVRVHVGPEAGTLGAMAFTHGSNLYFAPGQYDPATHHGHRLLARQLAHVVQQREGRVKNPFRTGIAVVQSPQLDAEAERMATRAMSFAPLARPRAMRPAPQRASLAHLGHAARAIRGARVFAGPEAKTFQEVLAGCSNDQDRPPIVMGHTPMPVNYTVPTYVAQLVRPAEPWDYWRLVVHPLNAADEGTVHSSYVAPGRYQIATTKTGRPLYLVVSPEISDAARAGEQEHLDDFTLAYQQTLGRADAIIRHLAANPHTIVTPEGGYTSMEYLSAQMEPWLNTAFGELGPDASRWGPLYEAQFRKSLRRDESGSHTMTTGGVRDGESGSLEHDAVFGKTFKLGVPSADILRA